MLKFRRQNETHEVAITVTTETFIRLALLTVGTILLLLAVHKAAHALLLIFTAFFLALALNGPVYWLSKKLPGKRRGNRTIATTLSFFIVVLLLGGFLASITPPLVRQTENFAQAAPELIRDFRSQNSETGRLIRKYQLQKQVDTFSSQLSERLKHIGGTAFSTVQRIGSSAFAILTIFVLTFMMLIEGPRWLGFMRDVIPDKHHGAADRLAGDMYKVVKGFVNGQVLLAAMAALFILPVVLILDIGYPIALLVIIFICGLIPMIGHTIGAIIVTVVALFHST
ncbi:MAG TPA: AI-2E family transporter, partial [Candidatus Saccharimonadales bacterium]|nr:AI-2E family transporter [Candidatus Saccharimonadales bacterium]